MRQNDTSFTSTERFKLGRAAIEAILLGLTPYSIVHFISGKHVGEGSSEGRNTLYGFMIFFGVIIALFASYFSWKEIKESKSEQARLEAAREVAQRDADESKQLLNASIDHSNALIDRVTALEEHLVTIKNGLFKTPSNPRARLTPRADEGARSADSSAYSYYTSK